MMHSVVLARRPQGNPVEADFAVQEAPLPEVTEGVFLTRNTCVSLDAGFRNWMNEDSGDEVLPAMALDEPVMGLVLAEVMAGSTSSPESSFIQLRNPASSEIQVLRVRKTPSVTSGRGASCTAKSASTGLPCGLLASTTECIISGVLVMFFSLNEGV